MIANSTNKYQHNKCITINQQCHHHHQYYHPHHDEHRNCHLWGALATINLKVNTTMIPLLDNHELWPTPSSTPWTLPTSRPPVGCICNPIWSWEHILQPPKSPVPLPDFHKCVWRDVDKDDDIGERGWWLVKDPQTLSMMSPWPVSWLPPSSWWNNQS